MGDGQSLLCPGDGHIAKSPLLLHFLPVANGAHSGKQTVLQSHQEYMGKFQALGSMHGHHDHGVISLIVFLNIRVQRNLFQKAGQGGLNGFFEILDVGCNTGPKFLHIFQAALVFFRILGFQHFPVAGADQQLLVKLCQAQAFLQKLCQSFDHGGKLEHFSCGLFQGSIGIRIRDHIIEGFSLSGGQTPGRFNGFGAQTPGRIVDDPQQTKIVSTVVNNRQIRQHILHFRPVKETHTADDAIRNTAALQPIFQSVGLGIGTVENGIILEILPPGV